MKTMIPNVLARRYASRELVAVWSSEEKVRADLTENVEQLQIRASLRLVRDRAVAALARLARLAVAHSQTVLVGRSHNVPAQATTLGKRFAGGRSAELLPASWWPWPR